MNSKSKFSNLMSFDNLYVPCLLLIIACRFTCGESKIWEKIKKSQNITKMIDRSSSNGHAIVFGP